MLIRSDWGYPPGASPQAYAAGREPSPRPGRFADPRGRAPPSPCGQDSPGAYADSVPAGRGRYGWRAAWSSPEKTYGARDPAPRPGMPCRRRCGLPRSFTLSGTWLQQKIRPRTARREGATDRDAALKTPVAPPCGKHVGKTSQKSLFSASGLWHTAFCKRRSPLYASSQPFHTSFRTHPQKSGGHGRTRRAHPCRRL